MMDFGALSGPAAVLAIVAGLLLVAAMMTTTIRRLRVLALGAGIAAMAFFALVPGGTIGLLWSSLFVLANGAQLAVLVLRRRTGRMLEDEHELFERHLLVDEGKNRSRLRDLIEWRDAAHGEVLMRQGEPHPPLLYLARGNARIEVDGQAVGSCPAGEFLGEMSLLSGQGASATVIAGEPLRVARFDRDALAQLARAVPEVERALASALNRGLGAKVMRMNRVAGGSALERPEQGI